MLPVKFQQMKFRPEYFPAHKVSTSSLLDRNTAHAHDPLRIGAEKGNSVSACVKVKIPGSAAAALSNSEWESFAEDAPHREWYN